MWKSLTIQRGHRKRPGERFPNWTINGDGLLGLGGHSRHELPSRHEQSRRHPQTSPSWCPPANNFSATYVEDNGSASCEADSPASALSGRLLQSFPNPSLLQHPLFPSQVSLHSHIDEKQDKDGTGTLSFPASPAHFFPKNYHAFLPSHWSCCSPPPTAIFLY